MNNNKDDNSVLTPITQLTEKEEMLYETYQPAIFTIWPKLFIRSFA
ncbi:hypothetical protein [Mucilaginibacter sp.]